MFWTCSRIFSVSAFMSRTSRVEARSRLFEPSVFSSLRISCVRKSSFLPTDPSPDRRIPSNWSRWPWSRWSSSATSERSAASAASCSSRAGSIGRVGKERAHALAERLGEPARDLLPPAGQCLGLLPEHGEPRRQVGRDRRALGRPHLHERSGGRVGQRLERRDLLLGEDLGRRFDDDACGIVMRSRTDEPALDRVTAGEVRDLREQRLAAASRRR